MIMCDESDEQWWQRMKSEVQSFRASQQALPSVDELVAKLDALEQSVREPLSDDEIARLFSYARQATGQDAADQASEPDRALAAAGDDEPEVECSSLQTIYAMQTPMGLLRLPSDIDGQLTIHDSV